MNDERNNLKPKNNNINNAQNSVRPFGIQNNQKQNTEEIRERLEASKKNNLSNESKKTSKDTGSELTSSSSSLPPKDGLERKINAKDIAKAGAGLAGKTALEKAKESDTSIGDMAKVGSGIYKAVDTAKKVPSAIKGVLLFLKTGIGKIVLLISVAFIAFVILASVISVLSNPLQLIISSIGMKFGLTGESSYLLSTSELEEYNYMYNNMDRVYEEGMTRKEVEEMINNTSENGDKLDCSTSQTIFRKLWLFLSGDYDLSDPCEFMQYFKKRVEKKESVTGVNTIAPGYIMNTFYYSFETQNYNKDGEPFITSYIDGEAEKEKNDEMQGSNEITSDLDAINLMFGHKRANGQRIFERKDVDILLDQYLLHTNYFYWRWEKVNDEPEEWDCVRYVNSSYSIDVDKYKLFLRYGNDVSFGYETVGVDPSMPKSGNRGYQADKNIIASYNATSSECVEEVKSAYGEKPPGLGIYQTKAYPNVEGDDGAQFTLANGKTYNYSTGYIYQRYPRYMEEFTESGVVEFDYYVAKEVEKFIEDIADRQDYANYLLGYESDVGKLVGKRGSGTTTSFEIECDYSELENGTTGDGESNSIGSSDSGNIKIELMFPKQIKFDAFDYTPESSMGMDLINLEKYVLGTVYAEAGDTPWQSTVYVTNNEATTKAYAIMVRSYLLTNGTKKKNNGESVIQIANATTKQTYCDPDEGCYRCYDSGVANNQNGNVIIVPIDSEYAKNNSQCNEVPALPEDSLLRKYVKETAGQVMIDSNGNIASTGYDNVKLKEWLKATNTDASISDLDYIELLEYQYGNQNFSLKSADCDIVYDGNGTWTGPSGEALFETNPLTQEEIENIMNIIMQQYPDLSAERQSLIRNALSLVGIVPYFWGGGHGQLSPTIDPAWGKEMRVVTAGGSWSTGTYQVYGLDCSGFTRWVYYATTGVDGMWAGAEAQRTTKGIPKTKDELRPGDYANTSDDGHVGIYLYTAANGQMIFVHCSPSVNGVGINAPGYFTQFYTPKGLN